MSGFIILNDSRSIFQIPINENLRSRKRWFFISTDKTKLDLDVIYDYLSGESYWAKNIPLETIQRSIDNSVCFAVYKNNREGTGTVSQIGFARVITDLATFAYLADVFIVEEHRGVGLSKWLMEVILKCEALQDLRSWMLATKDAHKLYEQFGFAPLENPGRFMRLGLISTYPKKEPDR